jgi:hypothetical protein
MARQSLASSREPRPAVDQIDSSSMIECSPPAFFPDENPCVNRTAVVVRFAIRWAARAEEMGRVR